MGKRELVALVSLSSWCLVIVVLFFLGVPWVCLQFVIVVFLDHTHLLIFCHCYVCYYLQGNGCYIDILSLSGHYMLTS